MTAELLRRGVTREQVLRIKDKYENSGVAVPGSEAPSQMRKRSVAVGESYEAAELDDQKAVVDAEHLFAGHTTAQQFGSHLLLRFSGCLCLFHIFNHLLVGHALGIGRTEVININHLWFHLPGLV